MPVEASTPLTGCFGQTSLLLPAGSPIGSWEGLGIEVSPGLKGRETENLTPWLLPLLLVGQPLKLPPPRQYFICRLGNGSPT